MTDYRDLFQVGDVVELGRAGERPAWLDGLWRVDDVSVLTVTVRPMCADRTVDAARDAVCVFTIHGGGVVRSVR